MIAWSMVAHAACVLDAPADAAPTVALPSEAAQVAVLLEIWPRPDQLDWARDTLAMATAHGVAVTVVLPFDARPTAEQTALAASAIAGGHELALWMRADQLPRDTALDPKRMRQGLSPWRAIAPIETLYAAGPSRVAEAILGRVGIRQLVQTDAPATGAPRRAAAFEGQLGRGVVLSGGPYTGPCGADPTIGRFDAATADRATQAIYGATTARWASVRVPLAPLAPSAEEGAALARWIEGVLTPAGVRPAPARAVGAAAWAALAAGPIDPATASAGRVVPLTAARQAADALADATVELPRELPGALNLTEAVLAWCLLLTDRAEGEVVRLRALQPPITRATSSLDGPVTLPRADVLALARALLAEQPDTWPAAVPFAGRLWTASEIALLLASAVRGEEPARTWPVEVPDPHAPGLGWGTAGLP